MGILESLFGGGDGSQYDMYGDLFSEKQKAALRDRDMGSGLLRMAGALAEAAKPTLIPGAGIGSAIGKAAAAMGAGGDESMERMLKGMKVAEDVRASQQKRQFGAQFMKQLQGLYAREQQLGLPRGTLTSLVQPPAQAEPETTPPPPTDGAAPAGLPTRFGLGAQPDRSQYGFPARPGAAPPPRHWPAFTPPEWVTDAPGAGSSLGPLAPPDELVAQTAPEEGLLARMAAMQQQGGGGGSGLPFQLASAAAIPGAGGDEVGSGGAAADYGVNYLQKTLGLAPHQARGAVRWMENIESGLKPDIVNPTSGAYGIAQHLGSRKRALMQQYGSAPSLENQFAFIADELRGPENAALRSLQNAKTENEAFRTWGRDFERPSPAEYARAIGDGFSGGGAAPAAGGGAAPAAGGGATTAAPSGLVPGLNTTPQGLAILNSMAKLSGLGEPFDSLLETYYKSPEYLGKVKRTTEEIETEFAGPKAAKAAAATQKYIQENETHKSGLDLARDLIGKGVYLDKATGTMKPITNAAEAMAAIDAAKPTNDIKEYNFYAQQEAARGGIPKPFAVWDVERRKASATSINTSEGFEAAQTKARVGVDAKIAQDVAEQAITGRRLMPVLDELSYLADKTPEGWRGALAPTIGKTLATIGVAVPQGASNAEAFQALAQRLVPIVREPGATSQGEMALYLSAGPALSGTANGRRQIIEINRAMIQRSQDIARVYRENIGSPNLYEKLAALDKPLFTDEQRAAMQQAAAPATAVPATAAPAAPGALQTPWGTVTPR